ncbi:hypothetical protein GW781_00380 [bacterium]|nr:hypothetical protein [bacterium]OIO85431.1 MAG: hypothetical protein AUK01_06160 [Anaerolineae bacterium CG2_30_57_67]
MNATNVAQSYDVAQISDLRGQVTGLPYRRTVAQISDLREQVADLPYRRTVAQISDLRKASRRLALQAHRGANL